MKNVDTLPVSGAVKERLVKFAAMHRMYGGPSIDIGAVAGSAVLVLISYAGSKLSHADLVERATYLFDGELKGFTLFYAINTPYKKHIPTEDGRHIWRIDKGPFVARITRDGAGAIEAKGVRYAYEVLAGELDTGLEVQLEKWIQMSIVRDGRRYDVPADLDIRDARPLESVLEELFAGDNLPDKVRAYKSKYVRGELGTAGQMSMVDDFTGYRCVVVCVPK